MANILDQGGNRTGVYFDGDFQEAKPVGLPLLEYPFQSRGDKTTFIVRQKWWQLAESFKAQPRGTGHKTYPKALLIEESPHRDLGGGVIEWERSHATVPLRREEPEGYVYEYQIILSDLTIQPLQSPVGSTVIYEYFRVGQEAQFPLSIAPKLIKAGTRLTKIGVGDLRLLKLQRGAFVVSNDATILATSDVHEDWKGDIRCRKRRIIKSPDADFWGDAFNMDL